MTAHPIYKTQSVFMQWLERRLPIASLVYSSFIVYPTPRNLNYWWTFGGILTFMLGVQIVTGVVLAMHCRLRLVSSQVSQVAPSRRPRWTRNRRLAAALSLLDDDRLDALVTPAVTFQDLPARLPDILNAESNILCQLIRYP
jgi:hypothetical protein